MSEIFKTRYMKKVINQSIIITISLFVLIGFTHQNLTDNLLRNLGYKELLRGNDAVFSDYVNLQNSFSTVSLRSQLRAAVLDKNFQLARNLGKEYPMGLEYWFSIWLKNYALELIEMGDYSSAVDTLDIIIDYGQVETEIWYELGSIYKGISEFDRAINAFIIGSNSGTDRERNEGLCHIGNLLYSREKYVDVVNLLEPYWLASAGSILYIPECRGAAISLGHSYRKLDQVIKAEKTYQQLVNIDIDTHDWQINHAQIQLGDFDLLRGDYCAAAKHYAQAYNIAIQVKKAARAEYEWIAWNRMEVLAKEIINNSRSENWNLHHCQKNSSTLDDPGWNIIRGLVCEKRCELECAEEVFTNVELLVPGSELISQINNRLPWKDCDIEYISD